jgi:phosphatidylglycerophosphatase A
MNDSSHNSSQKNNDQAAVELNLTFLFSHSAHFLALGLGSGLAPKAPGTFGTLAAVPIWLLLAPLPIMTQLAIIGLAFLYGIYLCRKTADDLGVHDHGAIVWDEFVGYLLTMLFLPAGWFWMAVGFTLFRFFDIVKPWPIAYFDKNVSGGMGIMIDDVLAAVYAGVIGFSIAYFII